MRESVLILTVLYFTLIISTVQCQSNPKKKERCKEENIPHYTAHKISDTLVIDGKLDEVIWKNA